MRSRRLAVAAAAVALLAGGPAALAGFSARATGGPLQVASATLAPPAGLTASNTMSTCPTGSLEVDLAWSKATATRATGYVVLRTSHNQTTQLASLSGIGRTSWTDSSGSLSYATEYTYTVETVLGSWTSGASVRIRTPNTNCH